MAQKGVNREIISCSICLDLLKDPVTIPCGHSYCMDCIKSHWDGEDVKRIYSCPQCRQTFTWRPVLMKNTMLADLVEELKKTGLQDAPADHCYAGPEDVACDVCKGRKLKAFKSCLVCLASYCKNHLQPHYDVAPLRKHKLVEPSYQLQENICPRHDEVMKMFCRTDQQCICYLCSVDEHQGHNTVSAAAERTERQRELEGRRQNIQQRIQEREEDVKVLQQEVENINRSADKAVEDSEKMLTELIRLMEKRRSDVKQQVRSQQQTEVSRVLELQEKLEQEITELKRKDAELKKLSHTEDHNQFLHNYPSVSALSEATHSSSINIRPLRHFEDVTAAVTEVRDKLQDLLTQTWTNISWTVMRVDALLSQPEPKTRGKKISDRPVASNKAKSSSSSSYAWFTATVKVFSVITGRTFGAHDVILEKVSKSTVVEITRDQQDCDVIMIFCPIRSRVGSDVEAAMRDIPGGKPAILVLMHHTRDVGYSPDMKRWSEKYPNIQLEVHVLFHETQQGLLKCERNDQAAHQIQKALKSYSEYKIRG